MNTNTGTIVSRTLQEAGLTPEVGMQVYIFKEIATIRQITGEIIYLNHAGKELQSLYTADQLKTLFVGYVECKNCSQIKGCFDDCFEMNGKTLPLNPSQWQQAIYGGYVDSGKEVQFEIFHRPVTPNGNTIATDTPYPFEGLVANHTIKSVATLIPQQDDLNQIAFDAVRKHSMITGHPMEPRIRSEMFKEGWIARGGYSVSQQDDVEKLADEAVNHLRTGRFFAKEYWKRGYQAAQSQQQKLYSEEEVKAKAWDAYRDSYRDSNTVWNHDAAGLRAEFEDWWEQNKKQ